MASKSKTKTNTKTKWLPIRKAPRARHKHAFERFGSSAAQVFERCSCGERRERPATTEEKRQFKIDFKESMRHSYALHRLWGKFSDKVMFEVKKWTAPKTLLKALDRPGTKAYRAAMKKLKVTKLETQAAKHMWRPLSKSLVLSRTITTARKGYDLMERADKFAAAHPEVKIVTVDDSYHSSSSMVMVPHEADGEYWGTSVLYIPQCSGEDAITFFLYPGQMDRMVEALSGIKKHSDKANGNLARAAKKKVVRRGLHRWKKEKTS